MWGRTCRGRQVEWKDVYDRKGNLQVPLLVSQYLLNACTLIGIGHELSAVDHRKDETSCCNRLSLQAALLIDTTVEVQGFKDVIWDAPTG